MAKIVLLADHSGTSRLFQRILLETEDCHIAEACNGIEAVEVFENLVPDLVILDLFMPDIRGDRICRFIKNRPATHHVPVILTLWPEPLEAEGLCRQAGCDAILVKPFGRSVYAATIKKFLTFPSSKHQPGPPFDMVKMLKIG